MCHCQAEVSKTDSNSDKKMEEKQVIEKLKCRHNWQTWKFVMEHYLRSKNLWSLVEQVGDFEGDAAARAEHEQKCERAFSTIVLNIHPSQLYLITSCTHPADAWEVLKEHFEKDTLANKLHLKKTYFRVEMKPGSSVEEHLRRMKELTDKLASIGSPIEEEDQIITLLGSLPKSYHVLVTALEARVDELTLNYVQQALTAEEQK